MQAHHDDCVTAIGDQDPSTFKILCVLVIHFVGKDFFYVSFFATNPGKFVPSFHSKGDNNNLAGRGLLTSMVVLAYELAHAVVAANTIYSIMFIAEKAQWKGKFASGATEEITDKFVRRTFQMPK